MSIIERASLACLLLSCLTALANPWLENTFWRRVSAVLIFLSAILFVFGGSGQ
ncbi:hypothetical protein [Sphingobium cupriresistens]|uniref:hypothetical protein n=1 Tax=Sphingobium cupriresistens TaxID=1132417 RepID=UPI0013EBC9D1|nr:hypothetical protein [Sphingobium cupriresistens]